MLTLCFSCSRWDELCCLRKHAYARDSAGMEGRTLSTAEWIKSIFAQGMVYTRLFDEKLGVSQTAKSLAAKVRQAALIG